MSNTGDHAEVRCVYRWVTHSQHGTLRAVGRKEGVRGIEIKIKLRAGFCNLLILRIPQAAAAGIKAAVSTWPFTELT